MKIIPFVAAFVATVNPTGAESPPMPIVEPFCSLDADCPQVACLMGRCPETVCLDGTCVRKQIQDECSEDLHCPQPRCAPGSKCFHNECKDGECVAVETATCQDDSHCPTVDCQPGKFCPNYVCEAGECIQKTVEGLCTKDAKICPDGSSVYRKGPDCEFEPCPSECQEDDECPLILCFPGGFCPKSICKEGKCTVTEKPEEPECKVDDECPQILCFPGGFCPQVTCVDGECVKSKEEPECKDDSQCPMADCIPGVPCPSFTCEDGKCVQQQEKVCRSIKNCPDGTTIFPTPPCNFAACPGEEGPEPVCENNSECPQPLCLPGKFCPEIVCLDGQCIKDKEVVECQEDDQCPVPACLPGAFCPNYVCTDGECVQNKVEGNCHKDAKVCSDGSMVYRQGPDCEFAPCPSECQEDDECPQILCFPGGYCPKSVCTDGKCTVTEKPNEPECKADEECPQIQCFPGGFCPQITCVDGECVKSKEEAECRDDSQCPTADCIPGVPCVSFMCEDGKCVQQQDRVCRSIKNCQDGSTIFPTPPCDFAACPGEGTEPECDEDIQCPQLGCTFGPLCPEKICKEGVCVPKEYPEEPEVLPVEPTCEEDSQCPQLRCTFGPRCPETICTQGVCVPKEYPEEPEVLPTGPLCEEDSQCPQLRCTFGPLCPERICKEGVCVPKGYPEEPECVDNFDCPTADCIPGVPCVSFTCEDGKCVQQEEPEETEMPVAVCRTIKHCPDGTTLDPTPPCNFAECPGGEEPECVDSFDCPMADCIPGVPCVSFTCEEGKCVQQEEPEETEMPVAVCRTIKHCPDGTTLDPTPPCNFADCPGGEEPECVDNFDCPMADCIPGVPCVSFTCEDGKCVQQEEPEGPVGGTCRKVMTCPDGTTLYPTPPCNFADCPGEEAEAPRQPTVTQPPKGGGDPHFRTWSGHKFDYHGECDLVLLYHPEFADGSGLKVHIRTTRINYFSYIETVAIQIGTEKLEFSNDLENYLVNGKKVTDASMGSKNHIAGYEIRRYQKAISIRLDRHKHNNNLAHIDLYYRKNGFPYVKLDAKGTDVFKGSHGLLGDYATGKMMSRDNATEITDPIEFASEWQVRDDEPMLFSEARFPQYPAICIPPKKKLGKRLGDAHMQKIAEEACMAWGDDKDECIFDVMATRDVNGAEPIGRHHEEPSVVGN